MYTRHHDQTASVQAAFVKDVISLVDVIDEPGNPFEEESEELIALHTKEFAGSLAVENVWMVGVTDMEQFQIFITERLVDRTKSIYDVIPPNKLNIFGSPCPKTAGKGKQQTASLKNDIGLFLRLYISCQTREGNLDHFFRHENQSYPPSLSDDRSMHLGANSDLLACLEDVFDAKQDALAATL